MFDESFQGDGILRWTNFGETDICSDKCMKKKEQDFYLVYSFSSRQKNIISCNSDVLF